MATQPTVSIITPVLNGVDCIAGAIESVAAQGILLDYDFFLRTMNACERFHYIPAALATFPVGEIARTIPPSVVAKSCKACGNGLFSVSTPFQYTQFNRLAEREG